GGHVAVERFLVREHGDAQAGVFERPLLQGVDEIDGFLRRSPAGGRAAGSAGDAGHAALVRSASDVADPIRERGAGLRGIESQIVDHVALALPGGADLSDLLGQRPARHKVRDASRNGRARVLVERAGPRACDRRLADRHRGETAAAEQLESSEAVRPGAHGATVSVTFFRSWEFGPTMIVKSPGSVTRLMSRFHIAKASDRIGMSTVVLWPGSSVMRSKPTSSLTGRVTELTSSRR